LWAGRVAYGHELGLPARLFDYRVYRDHRYYSDYGSDKWRRRHTAQRDKERARAWVSPGTVRYQCDLSDATHSSGLGRQAALEAINVLLEQLSIVIVCVISLPFVLVRLKLIVIDLIYSLYVRKRREKMFGIINSNRKNKN